MLHELALSSMIENLVRNIDQLFPVMPLADCAFDRCQGSNQILISGIGQSKYVLQFLYLQPERMQVGVVEPWNGAQLRS